MARSSTDGHRLGWRAALVVLLVVGSPAAVRPEPADRLQLIPTPPAISPAEAIDHVGEVVDLEATVSEAKAVGGRVVLSTGESAGEPVRIVVVPPMVGPKPATLVERYRGQRVRVRGRVHEFDGEIEVLVSDPDRVVLVDAEAPPPPSAPAAPVAPAASATSAALEPPSGETAPAVVSAPTPSAVPPPRSPPPAPAAAPAAPPERALAAAAPPPAEVPATPAASESEDCRDAQRAWRSAAAAAWAPLARLDACLAGGRPPCADAASALRRSLGDVAAAEERMRWVCGEVRP